MLIDQPQNLNQIFQANRDFHWLDLFVQQTL